MGSGTNETRTEMAKLAAMNVVNGIFGRPLIAGVEVKRYVD